MNVNHHPVSPSMLLPSHTPPCSSSSSHYYSLHNPSSTSTSLYSCCNNNTSSHSHKPKHRHRSNGRLPRSLDPSPSPRVPPSSLATHCRAYPRPHGRHPLERSQGRSQCAGTQPRRPPRRLREARVCRRRHPRRARHASLTGPVSPPSSGHGDRESTHRSFHLPCPGPLTHTHTLAAR